MGKVATSDFDCVRIGCKKHTRTYFSKIIVIQHHKLIINETYI